MRQTALMIMKGEPERPVFSCEMEEKGWGEEEEEKGQSCLLSAT